MHHSFASSRCACGFFGMLIPNKHINNCKKKKNPVNSLWQVVEKMHVRLKTASQLPHSLSHPFMTHFYVGCGLCFLDATSVSEATVTWCIMRIIFRCICVLPCLEARVTTRQKRETPLFFLKWPLAFLGLLSEDHPVVLARNDRWRSWVAWTFMYFLVNSMEFFLKISQDYQKTVLQFHPFLFAVVLKENNFVCWLLWLWCDDWHNFIVWTQFCRTFWQKVCFSFKKTFFFWSGRDTAVCWAVRQMLGDSPPGEQLWSTLWGLNYSFRMATCIQLASHREEDFTSRGSALPDSLSAHAASRPLHEKQSPQKFRRKRTHRLRRFLTWLSCARHETFYDRRPVRLNGRLRSGNDGVHQEAWALYGAPHWWKLGRISSLKNINRETVILVLRQEQQHCEDNHPPAYKGLSLQIEKVM